MISLQLGQLSGDSDAIRLNRKSIATLFSWVTRSETVDESRRLHDTQHQLLDHWDRIHLTDPAPAAVYLDTLLGCINVNGDRVTARPGSERVAGVASVCLVRALSSVGPESRVVEDTRSHYIGVIPRKANFEGSFCHTITAIHALLISSHDRRPFEWMGYRPNAQEHTLFAKTLVRVAHNGRQHGKVPRWVLRFSLHSMLLDPHPPASVIADCLLIVAIELGCNVSESDIRNLDERYARLTQLHSLPS